MYAPTNSLDATMYAPAVGWPVLLHASRLAAVVIEEVMGWPATFDQLPGHPTSPSDSAPVWTPQLGGTSTVRAPVGSRTTL